MLDKNQSKVLKVLNLICEDNVYKVIDYDTFLSYFPRKFTLSFNEVDQIMKYLQNSKYIDIKYSDNNTWCLCLLTNGKIVVEDGDKENIILSRYRKFMLWTMLSSGVMSFIGAALAIILFR